MRIEVFSCSGGMALGFRMAGLEFDMVVDRDPDAVESYSANLGHRPVRMDAEDLLRMVRAGWRPAARVELLVADPPCTPWSRAGKREGLRDRRDQLSTTVELVRLLRPLCWLIANVPGLDDGPNLEHVHATMGAIPGYLVDFRRFDAADYGVPQRRVRPFWFGRPVWSEMIRWPAPTHGDPRDIGHPELGDQRLPWVTCRQALGHLSGKELGRPIRMRRRAPGEHGHPASSGGRVGRRPTTVEGTGRRKRHADHRASDLDGPARTLTTNTHSDGALLAHPRHPPSQPDQPSRTITTKGDGRGAQGGCVIEGQGKFEWPWDRPSTTVLADPRLPPPGHHEGSYMSARDIDRSSTTVTCRPEVSRSRRSGGAQSANAVVISERAAAILQGFPDGWTFHGKTKKARWSQIGQAMPPGLAAAVAASIRRWLEEHRDRPRAREAT